MHPIAMKFSVVFIFCVSFLKERTCSLRLFLGEQDRSERNAPVCACAIGQRSTEQLSDTRRTHQNPREAHLRTSSRGARLREATRGAGADGMNTTENLSDGCPLVPKALADIESAWFFSLAQSPACGGSPNQRASKKKHHGAIAESDRCAEDRP